jgi:hypothetical protein
MAWMQRRIAAAGADIVEMLKIHQVLEYAAHDAVSEKLPRLDARQVSVGSAHCGVARLKARQAQRWAEVRHCWKASICKGCSRNTASMRTISLGLALLQCGAIDRAIDVIEAGHSATKGHCRLDELLEVIKPLRDDKDPGSPLGRLRAAIGEADACLLRDDLPGARTAIDRRIVWQSGEVQSLARLAEVELRADPDRAVTLPQGACAWTLPRRATGVRVAQGATTAGHELGGVADRRPRDARTGVARSARCA